MHGAIRIGSQARHWLKNTDLTCPSCRQKCDDIHLFLECETTIQAWKHVEDLWTSLQNKFPTLKEHNIKKSYKLFGPPTISAKNRLEKHIYAILDIILGHMQVIIWNSYNNKIFNGTNYNSASIIKTFDEKIKSSLNCFLLAMQKKAYVPTRWACPQIDLDETTKTDKYTWKKIFATMITSISIHKRSRPPDEALR